MKNHYIGDCMQQSGENIISRLKLNLKFGSGEDAGTVRSRADGVAEECVIPVLERVIDEYGGSGIGEIDSLELDLGQVTEDELPDVLEQMLRRRLGRIAWRNYGDLIPDDDIFTVEYPDGYEMPGDVLTPESYREALVKYLSKPSVPWNSESGFNPVELIVKAAEGMDRESLEKWIVGELTDMDSVRMVRLEEMLVAGLSSLVTAPSDGEDAVGEREDASEPEYGRAPEVSDGGFSEENGDGQVRSLLREMLKITRGILSSDEVGEALSFRAAAWKKYLLRSGIIIESEEADDSEIVRDDGIRRKLTGGKMNDEGGRGKAGRKHSAEIDGMGVKNSAATENEDWAKKDESMAGGELARNVEGESEAVEREESVLMGEDSRKNVLKGAGTVAVGNENETGGSTPIARRADEYEKMVERAEETIEERTEEKVEEKGEKSCGAGEGEGTLGNAEETVGGSDVWMPSEEESESVLDRLFVSDAGLVLIHPFIRMLFRNMELVDEKGGFVSWPARIHAVHLLRYLSGYGGEHFDHCLTLEKILCGLPAGYVLPVLWKPGQKDREEAEGLLRAVLSYWATLSKSSPEALQRSFLQRSGSVETDEGTYIVRVEGSAMDILMDDLPWELSMIVLPWLKQPIFVEWQR